MSPGRACASERAPAHEHSHQPLVEQLRAMHRAMSNGKCMRRGLTVFSSTERARAIDALPPTTCSTPPRSAASTQKAQNLHPITQSGARAHSAHSPAGHAIKACAGGPDSIYRSFWFLEVSKPPGASDNIIFAVLNREHEVSLSHLHHVDPSPTDHPACYPPISSSRTCLACFFDVI